MPHVSQPIMSPASANSSKQGATSSSGDDNTNTIVALQKAEQFTTKPSIKLSQDPVKVHAHLDKNIMPESSNVCLAALTVVSSAGCVQHNPNSTDHVAPVENVTIADELCALSNGSNADMDPHKKLVNLGNGTTITNRNLGCEPTCHGSVFLEHKNIGLESGPVCAINIPGGIDSFFDLWDTAFEFFFDIHYNKRAEINTVVPFEMHGIAICWENSPVYYLNIPKDLLWSEKSRKNKSSPSISATDTRDPPLDNWFEVVNCRWKRFSDIMGKRSVRKFTWNLKVQIQVLKKAVISVQRFGWPNLAGKIIGTELIDGSYLQLSSVCVKDAIDMCIASWILWPDEERNSYPNLEKVNKKLILSI